MSSSLPGRWVAEAHKRARKRRGGAGGGRSQSDVVLAPVFEKHIARSSVIEVSTKNRGAALETVYTVCLRPGSTPAAVVNDTNGLEGVQSVELRLENGSSD